MSEDLTRSCEGAPEESEGLRRCHTQDFVGRRQSKFDKTRAVGAQREHPLLDRQATKLACTVPANQCSSCLVAHDEQLIDPRPAAISRLPAFRTSASAAHRSNALASKRTELRQISWYIACADSADHSHQPLREHRLDRARNEIRRN